MSGNGTLGALGGALGFHFVLDVFSVHCARMNDLVAESFRFSGHLVAGSANLFFLSIERQRERDAFEAPRHMSLCSRLRIRHTSDHLGIAGL